MSSRSRYPRLAWGLHEVCMRLAWGLSKVGTRSAQGWHEVCLRLAWGLPEVGMRSAWGCHEVCLRLAQGLPKVGMRSAQGWHEVYPRSAWGWHEVCIRLAQGWHEVCPRLAWGLPKVGMSLCFGFVTHRKLLEGENDWNWKDMVVDMLWNVFSICPRVIALALFASYQLYWFWGIVGVQVAICTVIFGCLLICNEGECSGCGDLILNLCFLLPMGLCPSLGYVFTMYVVTSVPFSVYLLYWAVMFIENTVMISLWYQWSDDLGLSYHDIMLYFVILAYLISLLIKCVHCYFYSSNSETKKIWKWQFSEIS